MKKIILILITFHLSLFTPQYCGAQSWLWGRQGKNHSTFNNGGAIAMDSYHNAYLTGWYISDTLIFGTDTLFAPNSTYINAYLVKYDENGNLLWARSSQTSKKGSADAAGVATDKQNNVYITGYFEDTVYFQSFMVEQTFKSAIDDNVFLVKYNAKGDVIWAKQSIHNVTGAASKGMSVAIDKDGNAYVAGYFSDTINFGSQTLICHANDEAFLVKYDSNGNVLWAKQAEGDTHGASGGTAITTDKWGYIYMIGNFVDTVNFGSQIIRTSYNGDVFIVKYNSNGNVIWAKPASEVNQNNVCLSSDMCTDKNGNIYLDGYFADTANFGATTLIGLKSYYSIFWAKYDSSGNVIWAKQSYDIDSLAYLSWAINTDEYENLYLTGFRDVLNYSNAKIVFDSDTLKLNQTGDAFIFIKMDSTGKVLNGYIFPAPPGGYSQPLAVDSSGCYVYYGGAVDTSTVFGNDTLGTSVNPISIHWPFIARWSDGECKDEGVNTITTQNQAVSVYPNPTNKLLNIDFNGQTNGLVSLSIMDITGRNCISEQGSVVSGQMVIDVSSLATGMYFLRITNEKHNVIQKFIKQ